MRWNRRRPTHHSSSVRMTETDLPVKGAAAVDCKEERSSSSTDSGGSSKSRRRRQRRKRKKTPGSRGPNNDVSRSSIPNLMGEGNTAEKEKESIENRTMLGSGSSDGASSGQKATNDNADSIRISIRTMDRTSISTTTGTRRKFDGNKLRTLLRSHNSTSIMLDRQREEQWSRKKTIVSPGGRSPPFQPESTRVAIDSPTTVLATPFPGRIGNRRKRRSAPVSSPSPSPSLSLASLTNSSYPSESKLDMMLKISSPSNRPLTTASGEISADASIPSTVITSLHTVRSRAMEEGIEFPAVAQRRTKAPLTSYIDASSMAAIAQLSRRYAPREALGSSRNHRLGMEDPKNKQGSNTVLASPEGVENAQSIPASARTPGSRKGLYDVMSPLSADSTNVDETADFHPIADDASEPSKYPDTLAVRRREITGVDALTNALKAVFGRMSRGESKSSHSEQDNGRFISNSASKETTTTTTILDGNEDLSVKTFSIPSAEQQQRQYPADGRMLDGDMAAFTLGADFILLIGRAAAVTLSPGQIMPRIHTGTEQQISLIAEGNDDDSATSSLSSIAPRAIMVVPSNNSCSQTASNMRNNRGISWQGRILIILGFSVLLFGSDCLLAFGVIVVRKGIIHLVGSHRLHKDTSPLQQREEHDIVAKHVQYYEVEQEEKSVTEDLHSSFEMAVVPSKSADSESVISDNTSTIPAVNSDISVISMVNGDKEYVALQMELHGFASTNYDDVKTNTIENEREMDLEIIATAKRNKFYNGTLDTVVGSDIDVEETNVTTRSEISLILQEGSNQCMSNTPRSKPTKSGVWTPYSMHSRWRPAPFIPAANMSLSLRPRSDLHSTALQLMAVTGSPASEQSMSRDYYLVAKHESSDRYGVIEYRDSFIEEEHCSDPTYQYRRLRRKQNHYLKFDPSTRMFEIPLSQFLCDIIIDYKNQKSTSKWVRINSRDSREDHNKSRGPLKRLSKLLNIRALWPFGSRLRSKRSRPVRV